jgi:hypothetical protein
MTPRTRVARIRRVGREKRRLILELEPVDGRGALTGRLSDEADAIEFSGWLGLAAALERLLAETETSQQGRSQ